MSFETSTLELKENLAGALELNEDLARTSTLELELARTLTLAATALRENLDRYDTASSREKLDACIG